MTSVAFIGLGNMGSGMAANLIEAGHALRAFDLNPAARAALVAKGAQAPETLAETVAGADVVITMLPAGQHVRSVYTGPDGVFAHASADLLAIDCSTIDVSTSRQIAEAAADKGVAMVDAPVSGGVAAAQGGTLTFMVGGPPEAFARAEPVLTAMGKAVIHAGDAGAGQAAKICNNMLLAIAMVGVCEAFHLADKLGLDLQKFYDISSKASGQCWSMTSYCPVPGVGPQSPADNDYAPGFTGAMMLKDLRLAQDAAQSAGAATPMGAQAQALYTLFDALGAADRDFSGVMELISGELTNKAQR